MTATYPCQYCGETFTARGLTSHEHWCSQNPANHDEGTSGGRGPTGGPDTPDVATDGGLPDRETLRGEKNPSNPEVPDTEACPVCDSGDTRPSADALDDYLFQTDRPNDRAVLAYELSRKACGNPGCGAVWGDDFEEPVPMEEIV